MLIYKIMTRQEQLVRMLVREAIREELELNEFQMGNFKMPNIGIGTKKEDPAVSAAKKTLDAHFAGTFKKDDATVNNLITKLSPEDQKNYKTKLASAKKPATPQVNNQNPAGPPATQRTKYNADRAAAQQDGWYGESKKRS